MTEGRTPIRVDATPEGVSQVIENHGATVEWCDCFVGSDGRTRSWPDQGHWSLLWSKGVIGFDAIPKQDEEQARLAAAAFISLWSLGLDAGDSEKFARAFAARFKVSREGGVVIYSPRTK